MQKLPCEIIIMASLFDIMEIKELIKIVDYYYPQGVDINRLELLANKSYLKLATKCREASANNKQWKELLYGLKANLDIEITEFDLLLKSNPSFIAAFLTEEYQRPKHSNYESFQLILKVSVIAPVYSLYFDNFVSDWNSRLIRSNPVTEKESIAINQVQEIIKRTYNNYSHLDITQAFHVLHHLGNISAANKRKPYLDECIYGLYLSFHPHNIRIDSKLDYSAQHL